MNNVSVSAGTFADDIFKLTVMQTPQENALVSPVSLFIVLTTLLSGTRNETRDKLGNALRLPSEIRQDEIDNFHRQLIDRYKNESSDVSKLLINNMIIADKEAMSTNSFTPQFKSTLEKNDVAVRTADFKSERYQILEQVNSWVNRTTQGLIPTLLDQPPDPNVAMLILNSLYFQSEWRHKFSSTYKRKFYPDGPSSGKLVEYMTVDEKLKYETIRLEKSNEELQLIVIPYVNDMSMVIVYPPESTPINSIISNMSLSELTGKALAGTPKRIELNMPKFKFNTKSSVKDHIKNLGAGILFARPDLSGINETPPGRLTVTEILHATAIEVDEAGTKAAAVSAIEIFFTASLEPPVIPPSITLDRPFVFIIFDQKSNSPMFVGKLFSP